MSVDPGPSDRRKQSRDPLTWLALALVTPVLVYAISSLFVSFVGLERLKTLTAPDFAAWVSALASVIQAVGSVLAIVWAGRIARSASLEADRRDAEARRFDALRKLTIAKQLVRRVAQSVGIRASFRNDPLNTETREYREASRREIGQQAAAIDSLPIWKMPSASSAQGVVAARLQLEKALSLLQEPAPGTASSDHVGCRVGYGEPLIEIHGWLQRIADGLESEAETLVE